MKAFDAIVCGGGPAGACAALRIAEGGLKCLLIEAKEMPRGKVCGGALSARARNALAASGVCSQSDVFSLSLREQDSMSCCNRFEQLRLYKSHDMKITMIDRRQFDQFLFDRAVSSGVEVIAGEPVERLTDTGSGVITRSGRVFEADAIIGADGASGPIAMAFHGKGRKHPRGIGLEYLVPMPSGFPEHMQIHFGLVDYGYAWVFPRRDDICVGIGGFAGRSSPPLLLAKLHELLRHLDLETPPPVALMAAPLPAGRPNPTLGAGRVFLAGDAAGLADQLTGEGISHAIESGFLAADAVLGGMDRRSLITTARAGCLGLVRQSVMARHLVYHPLFRKRAMKGLRDKQKFFEGYWKMICGSFDYGRMLLGFIRSP